MIAFDGKKYLNAKGEMVGSMQKEISNELSAVMAMSPNVRCEGVIPYGHYYDSRVPLVLQIFGTGCIVRKDKDAQEKL